MVGSIHNGLLDRAKILKAQRIWDFEKDCKEVDAFVGDDRRDERTSEEQELQTARAKMDARTRRKTIKVGEEK